MLSLHSTAPLIHVVGVPFICCDKFQQTHNRALAAHRILQSIFSPQKEIDLGAYLGKSIHQHAQYRDNRQAQDKKMVIMDPTQFSHARLATTWPCSMLHNFDAMV
jgi:hypothetical protein